MGYFGFRVDIRSVLRRPTRRMYPALLPMPTSCIVVDLPQRRALLIPGSIHPRSKSPHRSALEMTAEMSQTSGLPVPSITISESIARSPLATIWLFSFGRRHSISPTPHCTTHRTAPSEVLTSGESSGEAITASSSLAFGSVTSLRLGSLRRIDSRFCQLVYTRYRSTAGGMLARPSSHLRRGFN